MDRPQGEDAVLFVRSKREAMDFSVVLLSQEVESIIERLDGQWVLLVQPEEMPKARQILALYQKENKRHFLNPRQWWNQLELHSGALIWCAILIAVNWVSFAKDSPMRLGGALESTRALKGEWWRVITAMFLHDGAGHLMSNLAVGFLLVGFSMSRYGFGFAVASTFIAGVTGNLMGLRFHVGPYIGMGASGMVTGGLGLLAVQAFKAWSRKEEYRKMFLRSFLAGLMLFVMLAVDLQSDVTAHLGGFVGGVICGLVLNALPSRWLRSPLLNWLAVLITVGFSAACWYLVRIQVG